MKTSLFELTTAHKQIVQDLVDNEGELTIEIQQQLELLDSKIENKLESYKLFLEYYQEQIDKRKLIIESLSLKNKKDTSTIEFLESKIIDTVKQLGINKKTNKNLDSYKLILDNYEFNVSPSQSVHVDKEFKHYAYGSYKTTLVNVDSVTLEQIIDLLGTNNVKSEFVPDKKLIKENLEKGIDIELTELVTNYNLKIK